MSETENAKKEYFKKYYETNKQKIRESQTEKTCCPKCNSKVNKQNINKHMKTKICLRKMEKNMDILKYGKTMFESMGLDVTVDIVNKMIEDMKEKQNV